MRNDAGINGDAQRIEQIAWMLFLKIYDEKENDWEFNEDNYVSFIPEKCRWRNWAHDEGDGEALTAGELLDFIDNTLFPTLKSLEVTPSTPMRSAIVRATFEDANQYMKDGVLLRQVVNVIDGLDLSSYEESHAFGEIYESILKEMQSAGSAGEFYTPRALTDFMAEIINPQIGEKMADFACGTGGFLVSWLKQLDAKVSTAEERELYSQSIYGIEKKQFPYMLCVTNMLLHNVESPKVMHDNSLTKDVLNYTDDDKFDVILMNPPYGGNEKNDVKRHFPSDIAASETADLFMVVIMYRLAKNGRAAVILPDGFLFGTDGAKRNIKEKLLRDFNLHTIIRLPGSIFAPYTSIATNVLFFDNCKAEGAPEGYSTKETWFYRLDMPDGYIHFSKTKPMKTEHCQPIRDWWNNRTEIVDEVTGDEKSRCFTVQELADMQYNLDQCKFPKDEEEILRPEELLRKYHELKETLDTEIEYIVSNFEKKLENKKAEQIPQSIKNPCGVLVELIKNIPERLKKSILQEAIEGRLVPQDPNDEPASVLLERIREEKKRLVKEGKLKKKDLVETPISEDEKPFEIPESWEWVRFGEISTYANKKKKINAVKAAPNLWGLDLEDIERGGRLLCIKSVGERKAIGDKTCFSEGDILYSKLRPYLLKVLIAPKDGICTPEIIPFTCYGEICKDYIVSLLKSAYIDDYINSVTFGVKMPRVSTETMVSLIVPLPPLAEQKRIVSKIEELMKEIDKL